MQGIEPGVSGYWEYEVSCNAAVDQSYLISRLL